MKNSKRILSDQRGMTLVEIIVVVVIIGLIAGIVGQRAFRQREKADAKTALAQISIIKGAIEMYRLDTGYLPTTQQGLHALIKDPGVEGWDGPYLDSEEIPEDPWKNPYTYRVPGTGSKDFDIISFGKDKSQGGDGVNADISK